MKEGLNPETGEMVELKTSQKPPTPAPKPLTPIEKEATMMAIFHSLNGSFEELKAMALSDRVRKHVVKLIVSDREKRESRMERDKKQINHLHDAEEILNGEEG